MDFSVLYDFGESAGESAGFYLIVNRLLWILVDVAGDFDGFCCIVHRAELLMDFGGFDEIS